MNKLGKFIALHSFKGGTGKSLIATNLALILAKKRRKICLLDLDMRAPGLRVVFEKANPKFWLNDFLDETCEIEDVLIDLSEMYNIGAGSFYVGLANPSIEAIQQTMVKDRKREMKDLQRLLSLRKKLTEKLGFDYVVLDTSPGLQYSSLNAIVASDVALIISVHDETDIDGTRRMIQNLYDAFEKKSMLIINRALCEKEYVKEKENLFKKYQDLFNIPLLDIIPLYCDILKISRTTLIALEKPEHSFVKSIMEITEKLRQS